MTPRQTAAIDRAVKREQMRALREEVKERERIAAIKADPAKAMRNYKRRAADRKRKLLDPKWGDTRVFPTWLSGMSTEQYVSIYQSVNKDSCYPDAHPLEFVSP